MMRGWRRAMVVACTVMLAHAAPLRAAAPANEAQPDRRIAITVDDLPWAHIGDIAAGRIPPQHVQLIDAIRASNAAVTGFVNEDRLEVEGKFLPEREAMLRDWLDAGAELGNHTYAHVDLHAVGMTEYQADILRGERHLRPLLEARGMKLQWFRHPFLRAGRSAEDKAALQAFLDRHGYRIAPVTIDNSDWIWAGAYRAVLNDGTRNAKERDATLARLRRDYVPYMMAKVDYYERQSIELLGYNPPQILLMHANALNAATYGALLDGLHGRGYRIVPLEEAMRDPAYARPDGYTGAFGPSWVHRWAMAEKKPRAFFAGEPETPAWVLELAGVASE